MMFSMLGVCTVYLNLFCSVSFGFLLNINGIKDFKNVVNIILVNNLYTGIHFEYMCSEWFKI